MANLWTRRGGLLGPKSFPIQDFRDGRVLGFGRPPFPFMLREPGLSVSGLACSQAFFLKASLEQVESFGKIMASTRKLPWRVAIRTGKGGQDPERVRKVPC